LPVVQVACVISFLILAGCGEDTQSVSNDRGDTEISSPPASAATDDMVCQRDDGIQGLLAADARQPAVASQTVIEKTPFRCLRLLSAADISSADNKLLSVNIAQNGSDATGQLQIPLHEIKTKAFLRDRSIAIFSSGRQFAAIEKECTDIRASGIDDVIAVLPPAAQLTADNGEHVMKAPRMTAPEFIAERAYGVWHFINLTDQETLESPLFVDTNEPGLSIAGKPGSGSNTGLVRTLVVFDGDVPAEDRKLPGGLSFAGQTFVLQGGLAGLQRYEAEATAMALALARPRINERGCS
jgi:hypothetical protein